MNAFTPIRTHDDAAALLVSIKRLIPSLPHKLRVDLIRHVTDDFFFSYGSDRIAKGCDEVEADLDDEARVAEQGLPVLCQYGSRADELDPDVWAAARWGMGL